MTDKVLKKLNGDYEKEIIEQTFLHHVYLNSEDLCSVFDIEYDSSIRWTISYKEKSTECEEDGFINLTATIGNKVLLDKQWEDLYYNTGKTIFESQIINYIDQVLGYNVDRFQPHYNKKVIFRNVHQQAATEELVLVSWQTIEVK